MKNLSIKFKIIIPMAVLTVFVMAGNFLLYKSTYAISTQTHIISDDLVPRIKTVLQKSLELSSLRRSQYNYLVADDLEDQAMYAERIKTYKINLESLMKSYGSMIRPDQDEQRGYFTEFSKSWENYKKSSEQVMAVSKQGNRDQALELLAQASPLFDSAYKAADAIVAVNERNIKTAIGIADQNVKSNGITSIIVVIVMLLSSAVIVALLVKNISTPVKKITDYMNYLSKGNLDKDVPSRDQKDEIGVMAQAIQVFKDNMLHARQMEAEQEKERKAKEARQINVDKAIKKFEATMADIVKFVASASAELQASAQSLSASAEETSKQSNAVAAASQQAAANVQTVASATEELSSSINEISSQVSRSSSVASKAVSDAEMAGGKVSELIEAAQKIGDITKIISEIAEQTNLLALNATIEAARAGEMGKGFAVVAAEVKNLATESTKATEQIASQISNIQEISQTSADAINTICTIIREIDQISGTISAAIQEQTAATQEISRNVGEAYTGTSEVTENIVSVSQAANDTGSASHQVLSAADELSRQSAILKEQFDVFIKELEAA